MYNKVLYILQKKRKRKKTVIIACKDYVLERSISIMYRKRTKRYPLIQDFQKATDLKAILFNAVPFFV